jgi:ADP-heptose:LPS heptosyltransferase
MDQAVTATDEAIVVYRLGSLGDTVVSLPCFRAVRARYPQARITVLTNRPVALVAPPLQQVLPPDLIDDAIIYPVGTRRLSDFLRIRREIRMTGARTLIFLGGGRGILQTYRDCLFFRSCGIKRIIGAPLTMDLERPRLIDGLEEHEAERLARCIESLGPVDLGPSAWNLALSAAETRAADDLLRPLAGRPFIAVNTGGKLQIKDWGEANWTTTLIELSKHRPDLGIVFVGADADRPAAERLGMRWLGPVIMACGSLTPRQSAAVLGRAALFVGHDSGPLHLAAAMQVPTVSVFGGHNRPRRWHPYGPRHQVLHDPTGVERISPSSVFAAIQTQLGLVGA